MFRLQHFIVQILLASAVTVATAQNLTGVRSASPVTCSPGFYLFEHLILQNASYSATATSSFVGQEILSQGTYIGVEARHQSGFISCDGGVSTSTEFAFQACRAGVSSARGAAFELQKNGEYVFAQSAWREPANGCSELDVVPFRNKAITCTGALTIEDGDSLTLGWYESTRGESLHDNVGTIYVDLVGFTCERVSYTKPASTACSEDDARRCHATAFCEDYGSGGVCECPEGSIGDGISKLQGGTECSRESWALQVSLDLGHDEHLPALTKSGDRLEYWEEDRSFFSNLLFLNATEQKPAWFDRSMYHHVAHERFVTIFALFFSKEEAESAFEALKNNTWGAPPFVFGTANPVLTALPRVYTFVSKTSEAEIRVLPTGMDVESVHFEHDCMASGCWVIDLIYTTGEDNFNVFYLPKAIGNDTLSYDFDYTAIPSYATGYGKSPADTFLPVNFPCGSDGYTAKPGPHIPNKVSACCIEEFTQLYRPVDTFVADDKIKEVLGTSREDFCAGPELCAAEDGVCHCVGQVQYGADGHFFYKESDLSLPCTNEEFGDPIDGTEKNCYCIPHRKIWSKYDMPASALFGNFSGVDGLARVDFKSVEDPFVRQFTATVRLDEVALRRRAGILTGAVGVAHAIDTFIGFANFKPTGLEFLDMFASQTNIHLEKTNFFTVSAYGENDYTFLEYVNLRLVAIYKEDDGFAPASSDFSRTNTTNAAHYLQVTFTLGAQYQPIESGIIPIDSVLVSKGDFISSPQALDTRFHACSQYLDGTLPQQALFDSRFPTDSSQTCAPNATMCHNPPHIPDQFVSFNVPLGVDWLPTASNDLSSNVFVDMVVSVIDIRQISVLGGNPNHGDPAEQMKTTLTASIPVVEGGVYIFCDKITVKDDLLDVANADLILGSAGYEHEFSRLRIIKDIASAPFDNNNGTRIDSDSIEAGLMTLVVKGNASYFARAAYALEVEDLITIHVMEPETGTKYRQLLALLATPAGDVSDATEGFALNGAFLFTVDRAAQRAALEPTRDLETLCPFSPVRPNPNDAFPETCVSRRDIRARGFPSRGGKNATAIELPAADIALDGPQREGVARFMQLVLNPSEYAAQLGRNFSYIVGQKYALNGRYNRAFWINPGYEWTPTQTGGQDIFTLSQKIVMFALINVNEGFAGRRRMLLQTSNPVKDAGAGITGQQMTFDTTPQSMMANLYNIPEDLVATFRVELQLTYEEACMTTADLRNSVRTKLDEFVSTSSSPYETVQVLSISANTADVQCKARRSLLRKLLSFSSASATVEMMVVFSPSALVGFDLQAWTGMSGINSIAPIDVASRVQISASSDNTYAGPTPSAVNDESTGSAEVGVPDASTPLPAPVAIDSGTATQHTPIATIAACAAGVVVMAGVAYFGFTRYQTSRSHDVEVVSTLSVADLKSELVLP